MGFFNKPTNKKESESIREDNNQPFSGLPELPSLPELPGMDLSRIDDIPQRNKSSTLPSFPKSQLGEKVNRDTVKEAIKKGKRNPMDGPEYNEQSLPPIMGYPTGNSINPETINMIKKRTMEIDGETSINTDYNPPSYNPNNQSQVVQPLFIKLDTFEKSVSTFNEVKLRVGEIETLLRNIKETKMKEENELVEWEREMEIIKQKLTQIDQDIFSKM